MTWQDEVQQLHLLKHAAVTLANAAAEDGVKQTAAWLRGFQSGVHEALLREYYNRPGGEPLDQPPEKEGSP